MTITNGTVSYERTTRPADFESKKASVTLSFAVEDGSDPAPVVAKVLDMAVAEVHRRLGLAAPVQAPAQDTKTKRQAKAPPAEVPAENPTSVASTAPASMPDANDVAAITPAASASETDPAAISVEPDPAPAAEKPIEYTDKDMHAAVHLALEKDRKLGKKIVDLTAEFTGTPGKSMTTIEQARRGEFIARIKALYND